jgi:hypothetical protein
VARCHVGGIEPARDVPEVDAQDRRVLLHLERVANAEAEVDIRIM